MLNRRTLLAGGLATFGLYNIGAAKERETVINDRLSIMFLDEDGDDYYEIARKTAPKYKEIVAPGGGLFNLHIVFEARKKVGDVKYRHLFMNFEGKFDKVIYINVFCEFDRKGKPASIMQCHKKNSVHKIYYENNVWLKYEIEQLYKTKEERQFAKFYGL